MMRYPILSVSVNAVDDTQFRAKALEWLSAPISPSLGGRQVVTVNPEFIMEAQGNTRFRDVLNAASCALADGVGLLLASRILYGKNVFTRMTGVHTTVGLCELASQVGASIYLVGGKEGVAKKTAAVLQQKYPALVVVGAEVGIPLKGTRTSIEYTDELLSRINTAQPAILFLAFGAPKQELWIADNLSKMPSVKIAMGVGGTFDYLSGEVPYAPHWIRTVGLEWLYRLFKEPRRANRIITATVRFPLAVIIDRIKKRSSDPE